PPDAPRSRASLAIASADSEERGWGRARTGKMRLAYVTARTQAPAAQWADFHELTHRRPLPGGGPAFVRVFSVPLLGGVRGGFMVPTHGRKAEEALPEPQFPNPNDKSR